MQNIGNLPPPKKKKEEEANTCCFSFLLVSLETKASPEKKEEKHTHTHTHTHGTLQKARGSEVLPPGGAPRQATGAVIGRLRLDPGRAEARGAPVWRVGQGNPKETSPMSSSLGVSVFLFYLFLF